MQGLLEVLLLCAAICRQLRQVPVYLKPVPGFKLPLSNKMCFEQDSDVCLAVLVSQTEHTDIFSAGDADTLAERRAD
jgi:hypothetical protein